MNEPVINISLGRMPVDAIPLLLTLVGSFDSPKVSVSGYNGDKADCTLAVKKCDVQKAFRVVRAMNIAINF